MTPRIATVTINPALDVAMGVARLQAGDKMRASAAIYDPGGGGINVARVVHALGGNALAIFAQGGATGRFVHDLLSRENVPCLGVSVPVPTRISVTVHDAAGGQEYRFVPEGDALSSADTERLLSTLETVSADWLVASGSLPPGVPPDFHARVARLCHRRGIRFALDTSGPALKAALHQGIDLLKVSRSEFDSIVPASPSGRDTLAPERLGEAATTLAATGAAAMIALTLGKQGAVLATGERWQFEPAAAVTVRSSVGAGDSFLAGLVLALARQQPPEKALRLAQAVAAASVMEAGTARVTVGRVRAVLGEADAARLLDAGQSAPAGGR